VLVVADSSPLIYLSRAGAIHVLPALFDEVVVPRTVWDEAVERRPAPGISALHQASWLRVVDDPSVELDLGLDPGETAAIALAESLPRASASRLLSYARRSRTWEKAQNEWMRKSTDRL
jgi:predicted nucleic acid-binding protein